MFTGGLIGIVGWWLAPEIFPRGGAVEAFAFGLAVGLAGVLGDLAESLVKRDCATKDASQRIPGFGGVLDVVDSVLFAAPVAYLWFALSAGVPTGG
jgi:phosphatidate cytidylyltransferase